MCPDDAFGLPVEPFVYKVAARESLSAELATGAEGLNSTRDTSIMEASGIFNCFASLNVVPSARAALATAAKRGKRLWRFNGTVHKRLPTRMMASMEQT